MKYTFICFLFLVGMFNCLHAQDKIYLRDGRNYEVRMVRIDDTHVRYTYPGETVVFAQPKSVVSYVQYADGRRDFFDGSQPSSQSNRATTSSATTSRTASPTSSNRLFVDEDDEFFWQDVKTTFAESDIRGMTRLNRVSASSTVSYRDAIQQLKKKAAALGGTTILVMEVPENEDIEIIGVVYKEEGATISARNANERSNSAVVSSSDVRRRRIAQQTDSYENETSLIFDDYSQNNRNAAPARNENTQSRQTADNNEPDAVYLLNGRTIKGVIEAYDPEDFVSIRVANGRVYEYSMDDVRRISQTSLSSNNRRASAPPRNAGSSRSNAGYDDRYNNNNRSSSSRNNNNSFGASGYKGTFDAGYNFALKSNGGNNNFEFNTSHGYQINEYLFTGAGVGLHIYSARDTALRNQRTTPHYLPNYGRDSSAWLHADTFSYMTLPIFLDLRGYLPLQNSNLSPFFMVRFGYAFNLADSFSGMGIFLNPAIGLKMQVSPMIGINFSVGYSYQNYGGTPKEGGYGYHFKDSEGVTRNANAGGISLKLGVEF